jgi:hypothetical protein
VQLTVRQDTALFCTPGPLSANCMYSSLDLYEYCDICFHGFINGVKRLVTNAFKGTKQNWRYTCVSRDNNVGTAFFFLWDM